MPVAFATPFGLVFVGDHGAPGEPMRAVATAIGAWCRVERCDAGAFLGDNFYPSGVASIDDPLWKSVWTEVYEPLGIPFHPALGNHDHEGNADAQVAFSAAHPLWAMPARHYAWSAGPVDFFVIDTQKFGPSQVAWLDSALTASRAAWKVVYGHHPVHSHGLHGDTPTLVANLGPLLEKHRVPLYLAGHDHDKQLLKTEAVTSWIVVGTGANVRPTVRGARTVYASSTPGFGHLSFDDETARLRFVDNQGRVEWETTWTR